MGASQPMDKSHSISTVHQIFNEKSQLIYRFVALHNNYYNLPKDCGSGIFLTAVEISTLKSIEDSPGITITELALADGKTKGAVSQVVKKLEQRGYLFRKRCPVDGKRALLHVSEEGKRLSLLHKKHSLNDMKSTLDRLLERCEVGEVDAFFRVIEVYVGTLEDELAAAKVEDHSGHGES
ncbi:hypothetical protein C4J81_15840 [Deltaproteobacteria bacterium Smac51]|nr:hypothetical protein C4J81_15840 [Deltaproteobacteria bacterium Smac51]